MQVQSTTDLDIAPPHTDPVERSGAQTIYTPLQALNTLLILYIYSLVSTVMCVQDKSVSKLTNIASTGTHRLSPSREHTLNSKRCRPGNRIVLKMLI